MLFLFVYFLQYARVHTSHHPCLLGVPAALQHMEPVAEGALLAEALQMRKKQCCQGFLNAPLLQQLGELYKRHTNAQTIRRHADA